MDAGKAFARTMRYITCRIKPNSYTYVNQTAILISCSGRDMGAIINFSVIGWRKLFFNLASGTVTVENL